MKKHFALLSLALAVTLPSQAQYLLNQAEHRQLQARIQQAVSVQEQIQQMLTVQIPVTKQYLPQTYSYIDFADSAEYRSLRGIPTYQSTVGCKAYALDDHWLIAGAACLWNGRHEIFANGKKYLTGLVEEDFSKGYLTINGSQIPLEGNLFVQPRFTLLAHVILVRIPQHLPVAATVKALPKINLLGLTHTNPLRFKEGNFFVNTSRFGLNQARLRKLKSYNRAENTVTIEETFDALASLSNDPLLYTLNGKVYWAGINTGVMRTHPQRKWDALPSKNFVLFNNSDLDFIGQVIAEQDPEAWARIAPRLHRDTLK